MPVQDNNVHRNKFMDKILEKEKVYFEEIEKVISSPEFVNDLLMIEKEIREKYREYKDIWKLKNKIKIPAERLVTHYIYMHFFERIKGIYPAAVSSDIGIKMDDIILSVDIKTIDTEGNKGDIRSTSVEKNQTSFSNSGYNYISTQSNLKSIDHYSDLPVLTSVVKIIYSDDGYSFKLSRDKYPTLVLACIPNGELSNLFGFNIIDNFKTYDYYGGSDGEYYKEIPIPGEYSAKNEIEEFVRKVCVEEKKYTEVSIEGKIAYYDPAKQTTWWKTENNRKNVIRAVKSGSTARFNNIIIRDRLDSYGISWTGYKVITIEKQL